MAPPDPSISFREDVFCDADASSRDVSKPKDGRDVASVEPMETTEKAQKSLDSTPASPMQSGGITIAEREVTESPSGRNVQFAPEPPGTVKELELSPTAQGPKKTFRTVFTKKIHWVSKRVMLGSFFLALAGVLGHHGFFLSLVGQAIGDQMDQQRTRLYVVGVYSLEDSTDGTRCRLGNGFAYVIQALLVISIDIAFTQV